MYLVHQTYKTGGATVTPFIYFIVRTLFRVSMASYQLKYMGFSKIPNFHFFQIFKNPKGGPFALKKSNFLSGAPRGDPGVPKIGFLVKTHIVGLVGSHTDTK